MFYHSSNNGRASFKDSLSILTNMDLWNMEYEYGLLTEHEGVLQCLKHSTFWLVLEHLSQP